MPGLQFEDLPAEQTRKIKDQLHAQWRIEADALNKSWFSDRGKFNTAKAKLNAKYQQLELNAFMKLQQQAQEQQRVQELIKRPQQFTPEQEAAERMRLGPEAERLAFPQEKYLSPTYLRSRGFIENIAGYAGAAETEHLFWTRREREPKKKDSLINQYQRWRESELYHTKRPQEQQQLDREWDRHMLSSSVYDSWWQDRKKRKPITEARALRTVGQIASAMREKITTPIGRSLSRKKRNILEKTYGTTAEMQERYGFPVTKKEEPIPEPATGPKPIRQINRRTGQERISYDGGKTWQMIG